MKLEKTATRTIYYSIRDEALNKELSDVKAYQETRDQKHLVWLGTPVEYSARTLTRSEHDEILIDLATRFNSDGERTEQLKLLWLQRQLYDACVSCSVDPDLPTRLEIGGYIILDGGLTRPLSSRS